MTIDPAKSIPAFYAGLSVFVTGATGFLGKVFIEKILRSFPDVREIFLLMRSKKELNVNERLQQMLNLPMQSQCYKRRLRRKIEKERQKRIRLSEVKRIVTQVQKSFGEESSESDENLNENLDESLEPEIFCEQNQETVIAFNRFSCDRIEHARESHDFEYEMNNDSFVADFLMLHGALTILSSPMLVQSEIMCHYSNDLLRAFINHSIVIYGKMFVVYNVHSLSHLAQECLSHGSLDKFSAFPFENRLKSLKSLLKSGYKPLQQTARRDLERTVSVSVHLPTNDKEVTLSHRHYCDGEIIDGFYFRSISIGNVVLQFVVLKFVPDDVDNDNICYDIGLTKWLIEVNEDMEGETYWSPRNVEAGSLVRKEVNADETWPKYRVYVKRYHDEYIKARNNVQGITKHDDSNYETEKKLGRGKRRKTCKPFSSSDSDEEKRVKKSTKAVAPPPNVPLPLCHDFYDSVSTCSRVNESQKKKLDIKVNLHKSRKIQGQQTLRSGVKEKELLVQNVLDARRKTAERLQENKSSQSLSSNKVINASNSKEFPKEQSQEHQIELQMQTERSKCNEQTLSEDNEVTEKNNDKLQQSEKFPQSLSNIEENSNFEDPVDSISSTDDSVANDTAIKEHVDILSKAASNFKHKRDKSSSSTTSEKENKMQDLNTQLSKIDRKLEGLSCKINTVLDRKLEELSCKINTVITNQGKLNKCLLPREKKILKPHNMPSLPFRNESDVQAMEKWLCDSENKIALSDYLTSFGSASDERKTATIIMQKLMYNSLAKNYNFDGHGEKRGLKTLTLWTVIEGALSLKFPDSDLDTALKTIKSWLRNASEISESRRVSKAKLLREVVDEIHRDPQHLMLTTDYILIVFAVPFDHACDRIAKPLFTFAMRLENVRHKKVHERPQFH